MAISAGGFDSNTVLTNYDYQLKKCMDLLASSNNTKDFLIKWKAFYCDTIMAGGLIKIQQQHGQNSFQRKCQQYRFTKYCGGGKFFLNVLNVLQGKNGSP